VLVALFGSMAALAAIIGLSSNTMPSATSLAQNDDHDILAFQNFVNKHHKNYITKSEFNARLSIFKSNLALIRQHNAENTDFKLDVNPFADWSEEEKQNLYSLQDLPEDA
jgi:hypothetical protein